MENTASKHRYTRPEAAKYLGISVFTLNAWESEGRAQRSTRVGRHSIYLRSDLDSFKGNCMPQAVDLPETPPVVAAWPDGSRVLRLPEVCHQTGLSKTSIYRLIKQGCFVPPIKLGGGSVGWPSHLVDAYLAERLQKAMEVA